MIPLGCGVGPFNQGNQRTPHTDTGKSGISGISLFGEVVLQLRLKGLDATGACVAPEGGVPGFSGRSPGLGLEMSSQAHQEEARLRASDPQDSIRRHWRGGEVWAEAGLCCYLCEVSWENL